MEIYLDANATTPVLATARNAALRAMTEGFGNPSSTHSTGLRARAVMDETRQRARRLLGAQAGRLLFVSGATEGIQTAVLSALTALRQARDAGSPQAQHLLLLYGATEHKAVPEALKHWNRLLGLDLPVLPIPVGTDGRHDLAWLRDHAPRAGLVCTMAANNETGVTSDLDGIEAALEGSSALWLVDSVQALGKLPMRLNGRRIDYAPFSGHKLYAPKGIGLLYVRAEAPFTPLMAGGGQEDGLRAGTENMPGIAAFGAVLAELEEGRTFHGPVVLAGFRDRLAQALRQAFDGLVFNAPPAICLPTTLSFSVPGLDSRLLLDVFDAAGIRVSGGSACGASRALPSYVLEAMGLPAWQTASAVRLSFGPAVDEAFIDEACARIRDCGLSLRASCLNTAAAPTSPEALRPPPADGLTRWQADGDCCYLLADAASRRCVLIDPRPGLAGRIAEWVACQGYAVVAVLATEAHDTSAATTRGALAAECAVDAHGWPLEARRILLGGRHLSRAEHTGDGAAYLLHQDGRLHAAFIGALPPRALRDSVAPDTLLLPARDPDQRFATTLCLERCPPVVAGDPADAEVSHGRLQNLLRAHPDLRLIDVREPYEQGMGMGPATLGRMRPQAVALSGLVDALPGWLALPAEAPLLFFCRTGGRSAQAVRALRRLGRAHAWSVAGGLALWPEADEPME